MDFCQVCHENKLDQGSRCLIGLDQRNDYLGTSSKKNGKMWEFRKKQVGGGLPESS